MRYPAILLRLREAWTMNDEQSARSPFCLPRPPPIYTYIATHSQLLRGLRSGRKKGGHGLPFVVLIVCIVQNQCAQ